MKFHHAVLVSLSLAAAPALAQTATDSEADRAGMGDRTYIAGTIGYAMPKDLQSSAGVGVDLKSGIAGTVAIGRGFGPLRAEIEGGYRRSRVDSASGFGLTLAGAGKVSAWSAMANLYFDPGFSFGPVQPYIGGGAGVANFRARDVAAVGLPAGLPFTSLGPVSGNKTGFAYQAMAGVAVPLGNTAAVTIGYRYFATPGVDVDLPGAGTVNIKGLRVHSVDAGVRFAF